MNTSALWCFNATGRAHVPPAADSDDRPQRFDCGKRPGLDQYGIEGGSSARGSEAQDKEVRALFKSIHQDHGAHRTDAEDFKSHTLRIKVKKSPEVSLEYLSGTRGQMTGFDAERPNSPAAGSGSEGRADAGGGQVQCCVRCGAGAEERPPGSLVQEARAYGQSRSVIPFSCAYLAAAASTSGRTSV